MFKFRKTTTEDRPATLARRTFEVLAEIAELKAAEEREAARAAERERAVIRIPRRGSFADHAEQFPEVAR